MKKLYALLFLMMFVLITVTISFPQKNAGKASDFPVLKGPYLGQKPPGDTPKLFARDIIAKDCQLHSSPVFSPDGNEVYWTQMGKGDDGIFFMKCINNKWSAPKKLQLSQKFISGDPFISPDGQRLYFAAQFLPDYDERIMYIERKEDGWSSARSVGKEINALDLHWQMSVSRNLDIYFQVRNEGVTDGMIYWAKFENGTYQKPEKLGGAINTEAWELSPYVSPDGSYIIFARDTQTKDYDLFISFRDSYGNWEKAINMGERINSPSNEICPNVTPDGKYLFFISTRNGDSLACWVEAQIIEELKIKQQ